MSRTGPDTPWSGDRAVVRAAGRTLTLTNLGKPFWPDDGVTKGDLLRYYLEVSRYLLPHLRDRPMVLRRYPNGVRDAGFFMKQAPENRPDWIETCRIRHGTRAIDFVLVQDLAALLWVVNLGCIDLNPWPSRRDAPDEPDTLTFDLDPGPATPFAQVREGALAIREALRSLGMPAFAKTTGSRGIHVAVALRRGQAFERAWRFAGAFAREMASRHPRLFTVEYSLARRPADRVLVDHKQMARGQTLASVYSVRPKPHASVSTPLTWAEVTRPIAIDDFRLDNVPARLRRRGDLWKPLAARGGRVDLGRFV